MDRLGDNSRKLLVSIVERVERVQEEVDVLRDDIREILAEARAAGFDTRVVRKVLALRRMDPAERRKLAETVDIYMLALGDG